MGRGTEEQKGGGEVGGIYRETFYIGWGCAEVRGGLWVQEKRWKEVKQTRCRSVSDSTTSRMDGT